MVSARTKELIKKDLAHLLHPLGLFDQAPQVVWERGKGVQLWDSDGKQYIDMSSGGVHFCNLGFARKELNDAAYEQLQKMSHMIASYPMSNLPAIEYAAELAEVLPGDINHVFFTNTGTESNEIGMQIARFYWEVRGQADKYKIICLARAYHGSSAFTRSLSSYGMLGMAGLGRVHPGVVRIPDYHCYRCPYGLKYPSCNILCARMLERAIDWEQEDTVAAFIAEPIQGPAGIIWPPDEYWPIVRQICSRHNILLVADCVQTGFCRTGKFWGVDNWNIVPDIMTMGKGINNLHSPLGAVGVSDKVFKDLSGKQFGGGSTPDANPGCVAAGRAALKIYIEEKMTDRVTRLGEYLHERLVNEFLPLPCVDDVMGRGLFQSFEIALNKTTGSEFNLEAVKKAKEYIFSQCLEKGVLTPRYDGYPRRMLIVPSYVITEDELDAALDVMLSVMKEVKPV